MYIGPDQVTCYNWTGYLKKSSLGFVAPKGFCRAAVDINNTLFTVIKKIVCAEDIFKQRSSFVEIAQLKKKTFVKNQT